MSAPCIISALRSDIRYEHIITFHDDVIKWEHFSSYWSFVRWNHRSPVDSTQKDQWRTALMFSLICAWTKGLAKNRDAGDLKRHRAHYDLIVIPNKKFSLLWVKVCLILWNLIASLPTRLSGSKCCSISTYWRRNKMEAMSQTTFSNFGMS